MQIVIDINEKLATEIKEEDLHIARGIVNHHQAELALAIKNGIPLPEHHGDLVDTLQAYQDSMRYSDRTRKIIMNVIGKATVLEGVKV